MEQLLRRKMRSQRSRNRDEQIEVETEVFKLLQWPFRPRALISHDVAKVMGTRDAALANTVQVSPETTTAVSIFILPEKDRGR